MRKFEYLILSCWLLCRFFCNLEGALTQPDSHKASDCQLLNGKRGTKVKLSECTSAVPGNEQWPLIGLFSKHEPIVCCPAHNITNRSDVPASSNKIDLRGIRYELIGIPISYPELDSARSDDEYAADTNSIQRIFKEELKPMAVINISTAISMGSMRLLRHVATINISANENYTFSATTTILTKPSLVATYDEQDDIKLSGMIEPRRETIAKREDKSSQHDQSSVGKRAAEMCVKYSKLIYKEVVVPPQLIGEKPLIVRKKVCVAPETLIVGGQRAKDGEYPHMAIVGFGKKSSTADWSCGASLISEQFLVTAAHCAQTPRGEAKWVRVGLLDIDEPIDSSTSNVYEVDAHYTHPSYNPSHLYHDIALLRLKTPVKLSPSVRPLCLNTEYEVPEKQAEATGWGRLVEGGSRGSTLMKVNLTLVDVDYCNRTFYSNIGRRLYEGINGQTMICAGEKEGGKDTCQGDSGGPLSLRVNSPPLECMHKQIGVTSFGRKCGVADSPAVYTRISYYVSWIEDLVWPLNNSATT